MGGTVRISEERAELGLKGGRQHDKCNSGIVVASIKLQLWRKEIRQI